MWPVTYQKTKMVAPNLAVVYDDVGIYLSNAIKTFAGIWVGSRNAFPLE
jgi:hypothetical protein